MAPDHLPDRGPRLPRILRFLVAGVLCWSLLIAAAIAVVRIKDDEAAAARSSLPSPRVALTPRMEYLWSHFPRFHDVVPVLAYHGVNTENNYLSVTRKKFAQQMLALRTAGFHTISMAQYVRYIETDSTAGLPSNPILLTFDDGRLDSYRGADQTLARFDDRATIFVVASWPESRPGWALHWSELAKMQESGHWDIQEHAGTGHHHIRVQADGRVGEFYAFRRWREGSLEPYSTYQHRVTSDVKWGEYMLRRHIPGYRPLGFAVPYSNYGQRFSNDERIPNFFLSFLHTQFPVVIDGDYLDEGEGRPHEIKGRGGEKAITYRITQGPVESLPVLACRLRDFVLQVPLWREYSCLGFDQGSDPSVYSG